MTSKKKTAAPSALTVKIADGLFLTSVPLGKKKTMKAALPPPVHHVAVIDCSGSMYNDLPRLREQFKKKLPKMLGERDTFSCIWFSGSDEAGILLEAEPVATAKDLSTVHQVIDRWIKPMGLTGFVKPLRLVKGLVSRLKDKSEGVFSLFFMSDGQDNQWGRAEILSAVEEVGALVQATTIVEYGYYADRAMLGAMAEKAGGKHIFAEDFDNFVASMEKTFSLHPPDAPRVEVTIGKKAVHDVAFSLDTSGDIITYAVVDGKVSAYESAGDVYFLSTEAPGDVSSARADFAGHYAALAVYASRMKSDIVFAVLKDLADVAFVERYVNCFGKQAYSLFIDQATKAAFDPSLRFKKGRDPNLVPREDAFTILDLLALLQADECRLLLDSGKFNYKLIGRRRIDADESDNALDFARTTNLDGYEIRDLTFNQARPNVSVLVRREGYVDLSKRILPKQDGHRMAVPKLFPTWQFKNYALIKDGLVNVRFLPANVKGKTLKTLMDLYTEGRLKFGAISEGFDLNSKILVAEEMTFDVVFDLAAIPLMARRDVKNTTAADFFAYCYALIRDKAHQKVINDAFEEEGTVQANQGYAYMYGEEAAAWLKDIGLHDRNGYQPPETKVAEKTGDFYMSKMLRGAIKGLGDASKPNLPKVEEARSGKGGAGGKLMRPFIEAVDAKIKSVKDLDAQNKQAVLDAFLKSERDAIRANVRRGMLGLSKMVFNVIVGQVWFSEFASLDDKDIKLTFDGVEYACTAKLEEEKIEL
jgi:hypothetical protein